MEFQLTTDNAANKVALSGLRKAIRGHYAEVATRAGVHYVTVAQVLNGKWINNTIINAALDVKRELEERNNAK